MVAKKPFMVKAVMKSFEETGLFPYNRVIIEELACINHQSDAEGYVPTERDDYIVQQIVMGLQKVLSQVKEEVKASQKKITRCYVKVKKNHGYFAEDMIAENAKREMEEEIAGQEKAGAAAKKELDKKRKFEETEQRKQRTAPLVLPSGDDSHDDLIQACLRNTTAVRSWLGCCTSGKLHAVRP